jgi:hypothetical protein
MHLHRPALQHRQRGLGVQRQRQQPGDPRWLGEVVGKEGETLDRHDRWLCMMYPRLVLLKQFLREDGRDATILGEGKEG